MDYSNVDATEEDGKADLLVKLVMADGRSLCSHSRYKTQRPVQVMYYTFDGTARGEGEKTLSPSMFWPHFD